MQALMTIQQQDEIRRLIAEAEKIAVVGHQNPDGDAVGAVIGIAEWVRDAYGKTCTMLLPDAYPDFLQWMPNANFIVRNDKQEDKVAEILKETDLLFCVDFNDVSRVGEDMKPVLSAFEGKIIHIDHHIGANLNAAVTLSEENVSSTCEIILRMVMEMDDYDKMDKGFCTAIFTGMMTDTGNFAYDNAGPDTYYLVSELLRKGVNRTKIHRCVYDNFSEWRLRLVGYVLHEKLVNFPEKKSCYFTITKEEMERFHFKKGDAEGLVNLPLQMHGQRLSISLREDTKKPNTVWVSTRSIDKFPCNKLCEQYFNGGGHLNASGGKLNCTMEEAIKITEKAILEFKF